MPPFQPVYLDCAATTPLDPRVREVVLRHFGDEFGNAASRTHCYGEAARSAVEQARVHVAALAAARRSEVIFTSGATESNNLASLGLAEFGRKTGRRHLVSTAIEHHAVLEPLRRLSDVDFELTLILPQPNGAIDAEELLNAVRDDTLLVSVMHANNETGVLQPIADIAAGLASAGREAFFHVDAAQSFGKELTSLRHERIDLISASGHKLHGPQGVGALVARRRRGQRPPLAPLALGGGHELGLRPGTLPVALVAGFGEAARLALVEAEERNERCRRFKRRLLAALEPLGPTIHGDVALALPQIVDLSIPGLDSDSAIDAVADLIAISNGAACTTTAPACSHVLEAMRVPEASRDGALRLSWYHDTPEPDWPAVVAAWERRRRELAGKPNNSNSHRALV